MIAPPRAIAASGGPTLGSLGADRAAVRRLGEQQEQIGLGLEQLVVGRGSGPRLLHRQLGYTSRIEKALPREPEAISAAEQERMSQRARDAERARTRDAWTDANRQINDAVSTFRERTGHVSPNVRSGVRAVLRASEQVGRKLAR